jgi:hypothetical protein
MGLERHSKIFRPGDSTSRWDSIPVVKSHRDELSRTPEKHRVMDKSRRDDLSKTTPTP